MAKNNEDKFFFTKALLKWHLEENKRDYPWTRQKDPYKIWLSEIILQQTRTEQGLPYYQKFIEHYPDIHSLAAAPEEDVFRLWQGLGYYSRCRNLIASAKTVSRDLKGVFPQKYEDILALKGVGDYTAAAVASFAFGLPYAVLDGNVYRLLSRFFGSSLPVDSREGKAFFKNLSGELLVKDNPAEYNQAIMDFGASVCRPKAPLCADCPLSERCIALKENTVDLLPVKEKKIQVKERLFHYFVLRKGDDIFIRQRMQKDIWQNLFEFYRIEQREDFRNTKEWETLEPFIAGEQLSVFAGKQRLTHQVIHSEFHILHLKTKPEIRPGGHWVKSESLKKYAFPKTILSFLNGKKYF
jgi:A/G-specific adenine glycosylase